ncbi:MAG: signal peptidase I [Eubacterium sp.]|nr:signal peptidase I [Eubacterium sp.]
MQYDENNNPVEGGNGPVNTEENAPVTDGGEKAPESLGKRAGKEILSYLKIIAVTFVVCFVLTRFVFVNAYIPSSSMEETIMTGDHVLGVRLAYLFQDPARGDIVVFHYPVDEETLYIKRIIGLPGENVRIESGSVYIDGELLEEDYLPEEWINDNDGYDFEVPEGCYLMLGDNRNVSVDSRFWADKALSAGLATTEEEAEQYTYVEKDKIVAKAWVIFWPFEDIGLVW